MDELDEALTCDGAIGSRAAEDAALAPLELDEDEAEIAEAASGAAEGE